MRKIYKLYAAIMLWKHNICLMHLMNKKTYSFTYQMEGCYGCLKEQDKAHEPTESEVKKHSRQLQSIAKFKAMYSNNK